MRPRRVENSTAELRNCFRERTSSKLRLFCIHYSGGEAPIYGEWQERLPRDVQLCSVQLRNSGSTTDEDPLTYMKSLVEDAADAVLPFLDKPFALYGHGDGALVGFEAARWLRRRGIRSARLFVSGCAAPQLFRASFCRRSALTPREIDEVCEMHDIPITSEESELNTLTLHSLRADVVANGTYVYVHEPPLDCSISAFGGLQDPNVSCTDLEAWRCQTTDSFTLHMFRGDHLFFHTAEAAFLSSLCEELGLVASRAGESVPELAGICDAPSS